MLRGSRWEIPVWILVVFELFPLLDVRLSPPSFAPRSVFCSPPLVTADCPVSLGTVRHVVWREGQKLVQSTGVRCSELDPAEQRVVSGVPEVVVESGTLGHTDDIVSYSELWQTSKI